MMGKTTTLSHGLSFGVPEPPLVDDDADDTPVVRVEGVLPQGSYELPEGGGLLDDLDGEARVLRVHLRAA